MDETAIETDVPSVGERLRAAREAKGMSLEDIAAQTRIPQRHLESLELSRWDQLPAPTYTMGFARSYATSVGLDRTEISDQLRTEMGGSRPPTAQAEVFEPADPARTMPRTLVFGAIGAVLLLVVLMSWLNKRSLEQPEDANNVAAAETSAPAPQAAPQAAPAAAQQVTVTASQPVWLEIREKGGAILYSAMMVPGQGFTVPPTAVAPVLKTGKPEALKITVGTAVAPPVGPPATTVNNVSLLPADLMHPQAAAPAPPSAAASPPPRARPRSTAPATTAPAPAPAQPPPPTNTVGQ